MVSTFLFLKVCPYNLKPYLITLALNGQGSVVHPFLLIIQSVQDSGQSFPHLLANSPNLVPSNLPAAT